MKTRIIQNLNILTSGITLSEKQADALIEIMGALSELKTPQKIVLSAIKSVDPEATLVEIPPRVNNTCRKSMRYTEIEDNYIRNYYRQISTKLIAKKLKRTPHNICWRAFKLGLSKKKKRKGGQDD
jgi:hypothetical protein